MKEFCYILTQHHVHDDWEGFHDIEQKRVYKDEETADKVCDRLNNSLRTDEYDNVFSVLIKLPKQAYSKNDDDRDFFFSVTRTIIK